IVWRLVLGLIVLLVAAIATGCGAIPNAKRAESARHELRQKISTMKGIAKAVHVEKRADALYDDDGTDDDDDEIGLACPQTDGDDDDAQPQSPSTLASVVTIVLSEPPPFQAPHDTLGPSHGHRSPDERPPRA